MKRIFIILLATTLALTMFTSCGKTTGTEAGAPAQTAAKTTETTATAKAVKDTLVIGVSTDFQNLLPVCNNVPVANSDGPAIFALYDSLLWRNCETGEITSCICKEYSISDNGLEYTLILRDDVYFHNGAKMTSEDVAWSLNLLPGTTVQKNNYPTFDHAEVVDEYTVKLVLTAPFAPMVNALAAYHVVMLNKAYFDEVGLDGYMKHPIGTGPYAFSDRIAGSSMTLVANEKYWGGSPKIKKVTFSILPDMNTQIISMESGDIDVMMKLSITNALRLDTSKGVEWGYTASDSTSTLSFNGGRDLLNNENFRKAVLSGINYEGINKAINGGYTTKANAIVRPGLTGRPEDGTFTDALKYDLEAAKDYLSKSSYVPGSEVSVIVRSGSTDESVAKVLQGDLQNVGINVQVNAVDAATYSASTSKGDFDISLYTQMPSLFDIHVLFQQFNANSALMKLSKFEDKQVLNDLGVEAMSEMDSAKRVDLYRRMLDIVNGKALQGYIYYDVNAVAWRAGLKNLHVISGTNYRINEWYWE